MRLVVSSFKERMCITDCFSLSRQTPSQPSAGVASSSRVSLCFTSHGPKALPVCHPKVAPHWACHAGTPTSGSSLWLNTQWSSDGPTEST